MALFWPAWAIGTFVVSVVGVCIDSTRLIVISALMMGYNALILLAVIAYFVGKSDNNKHVISWKDQQ